MAKYSYEFKRIDETIEKYVQYYNERGIKEKLGWDESGTISARRLGCIKIA